MTRYTLAEVERRVEELEQGIGRVDQIIKLREQAPSPQRKMPDLVDALREAEIQRQVLDYLRLRRIPATRNQAGHVRVGSSWINLGNTGWPDIIACWRGRFLGIEVKRPGEEPTPAQQQAHAELEDAGARILVVHDLAELEAGLRILEKQDHGEGK